jgi:hypothetical protein
MQEKCLKCYFVMDCGGLMETYCDYEENHIIEVEVVSLAIIGVNEFVDAITKIFDQVGELM